MLVRVRINGRLCVHIRVRVLMCMRAYLVVCVRVGVRVWHVQVCLHVDYISTFSTGNEWSHRHKFVKCPHKFYPLEIDYGQVSNACLLW